MDQEKKTREDESGPLFTMRQDVLPQDLVMTRSGEIRVQAFPIALQFSRRLHSRAADMPVKSQSDYYNIQTYGFGTSRDLAVRRPSA